jgi:glycosyltransferase involved in cell wall biosynthesis
MHPSRDEPLRVLTVARWYPSHDSPGRGSFVSDLVAATVAAGVDARVASFDRVLIRGRIEWRDMDRVPARAAFDRVSTPDALFVTPLSYGAAGVPVARLPVVRRPGSGDVAALVEDHLHALQPFVRRLIETWRPDVIHAHTGLPDGVAAVVVGRELGIPVVVSEHASTVDADLVDPDARDRYRSLFDPDVRLVAVSPSLAARIARGVGLPAEIGNLPDPVADEAFPLADPDVRDANVLLWVGSRGEHKGIDVLLEAFARIRATRAEVRLRLIGEERADGDRKRWEALAATLGIRAAVTFEGWLDRAAVAEAMARAGVLVHPSPSETFGVAAAEAILTGLPVATRRSGGVPWIVDLAGGYGRVAENDDAASFAAAIEGVLAGGLPVTAVTARERLVDAVGAKAVAARAVEIYREVVGDRGTGGARSVAAGSRGEKRTLPKVVLATGREGARQLMSKLPADLQQRLVLVLPAQVGRPEDPDAVTEPIARIVEAAPVPPPRPRPRGRSPMARLRRAFFRPGPTADDQLADAIARAARLAGLRRGAVEVVAIDAPAVMVVERLGPGRTTLAPGSLRWLADSWDAGTGRRGP